MGFKRRRPAADPRQLEVDERLTQSNGEPSIRQIHDQMHEEIFGFAQRLVKKYQDYYGRDCRKQVSHLFEQAGIGIHGSIENELRLAREELIEARIAAEKVAVSASSDSSTS